MGSYKGQITLINVNDGPPGSGIGIKKSEVFYVASSSGTNPPEDGWQVSIPSVNQGDFLWTKTVITFTDDSQQISYSVSYQGINGDQQISSSTVFNMDFNQYEILKFYTTDGKLYATPEQLQIRIYKSDASKENGQVLIENLNINNFTINIYNPVEQQQIIIDNSILSLSGVNNSIAIFDITKIASDNQDQFSDIYNIFSENETYITIEYLYSLNNNNYKIINYISTRYGLNKDMAKLSLNANGIVAAIQSTKINFDTNGITIQNGGLTIRNNNEEEVLYADQDGNLIIKGTIQADNGYFKGDITGATGTFSGRLEASEGFFSGNLQGASGTFTGDISGSTGNIGGFILDQTRLTSKKINESNNPYIILDGENGLIEAENIILGTGARIKEYMQIGENTYIKNAISQDDSFISVLKDNNEIMSFKANGEFIIGNSNTIILNGQDGTITSSNYINGLGWKLSNTESIFNDVVIKGSIKASVIEYGVSQAIGGTLLVRPSSRIKQIVQGESTSTVTVEDVTGFNTNDWCLLNFDSNKNYYQIVSIDENNLIFNGIISTAAIGYPIIDFGNNSSVGISINGSIDSSLTTPESITVFEFNEEIRQLIPKIILGKLPNEEQYGYASGTYGLYAENVLLKGSLVTQTNTGDNSTTYSGISTLYSGLDAPTSDNYSEWFGDNTGEILLWAGALGTSKEQVENSKFFVDRNGNLFAGSGYFKGTIITDATISASEIQTAILTGAGENPALTIKDAKTGIFFSALVNEEYKNIFTVSSTEITSNVDAINLNNFKIKANGYTITPFMAVSNLNITYEDTKQGKGLIIQEDSISYTDSFKENEFTDIYKGYIKFGDTFVISPDGLNETITSTSNQTNINNQLNIYSNVKYGDLVEYKPVYENQEIIGYDLYIE